MGQRVHSGRPGGDGVPTVRDDEIWAAVGAEADWMIEVLERLVAAPPVLGNEEPGQVVMGAAFRDLGLDPIDLPLDAAAIRADPHASPFSWDVSDKRNVLATWGPGDMKAGLGAMAGAIRGLRRLDVAPLAPIHLQSVVEEECTGNGALQCL